MICHCSPLLHVAFRFLLLQLVWQFWWDDDDDDATELMMMWWCRGACKDLMRNSFSGLSSSWPAVPGARAWTIGIDAGRLGLTSKRHLLQVCPHLFLTSLFQTCSWIGARASTRWRSPRWLRTTLLLTWARPVSWRTWQVSEPRHIKIFSRRFFPLLLLLLVLSTGPDSDLCMWCPPIPQMSAISSCFLTTELVTHVASARGLSWRHPILATTIAARMVNWVAL